jgi:alpha-beta hydrolase superfamily lysophospholipase
VGIALAEFSLHVHRRPVRNATEVATVVREQFHSELQSASISARDEAVLRGWYVRPRVDNQSTVILLHGVTDNREGVVGYSRMFLQAGYRVLLPDSRAHGESGGEIATYGLLERDDVHRWAEWARSQPKAGCVYLFGESMGAAIALQATASDSDLCAVVVESPYSTSGRLHLIASRGTAICPYGWCDQWRNFRWILHCCTAEFDTGSICGRRVQSIA